MCPCTMRCLRTATYVSAHYDTRANARLRRQACCYAKAGMRRQVCEGRYAKAGMRRQVCCYVCVRALLRQVCEGRYAKAGMLLCLCPRTTLYVSSCSHHIYVAAKLSRHDVETGRPVRGRPPSACRELDSWLTSSSSASDYNDDATRASSDSQFAHAEFRIVYLGRGVSPCLPGRSR